jgi:TonB family protein
MRRLVYPALILLPILAHAQAKIQTSTLTASPSRASVATLEAKANTPNVLPAAAAPAAVDPGTAIMVPVHQTVVERNGQDNNSNDSTLGYGFNNSAVATTAPKLIQASPLTMSLRDMESETAEADVVLHFTVDLAGTAKDVKVVHSGGATLDKRAIEAINLYRFKPATQNNVPVEAPVTVEIKIKKS